MHLDSYGLPVQSDGDNKDQLQRVGMIATGWKLLTVDERIDTHLDQTIDDANIVLVCRDALKTRLQPKPGIYTRYVGGNTNDVSADQLISALAYWIVSGNVKQSAWMFFRMLCRLGFAQNYIDGLNVVSTKGETSEDIGPIKALFLGKWKLLDFMLLRSLPLFTRASIWLWPACLLADVLLVLAALGSIGPVWRDDKGLSKRGPDDVDDNLIILTLATCNARFPTPLSWLAAKLYSKFRPWNYGCVGDLEHAAAAVWRGYRSTWPDSKVHRYHPVYGALRWYHRAEAGGNPEIAKLWKPIVERYLT